MQIFSPGKRNAGVVRKWNVSEEDRVILFMGTIYRFSGLDRMIQDFPLLTAEYPNAKLLIAGSGDDEARLRRLASERGLSSHVIFTGLLPYDALPDLIRSSDVCINPFELNGVTQNILPTKLFQYLACAKPVVATELPGTIPFLRGEEHGIVYAPLTKFVPALTQLLSDPDRMMQLGKNGARAVHAYDWHQIAETMAFWMKELA
jgi:glycosyltransferase involved in cell wall biosynthesis